MKPLAIVLVTWNQREDALECLTSLDRTTVREKTIIVVDNGSQDGTPETVRRLHPEVTLLEAGRNIGFAAANNLGIRLALEWDPPFVFLLNTDTTVDTEILGALLEAMESEPHLGIAGPQMYFYHEPDRIWFAGGETDIVTGFSTHWRFGELDEEAGADPARVAASRQHRPWGFKGTGREPVQGLIRPCSFVNGAGMFVRSEVFRTVGLLAEEFFHTAEDTDFCHRAREAGFLVAHVPRAKLWHKVRSTAGGAVRSHPLYVYYEYRNKLLVAGKHASARARARALPRTLVHLARAEWAYLRHEKNPAAAAAVLQGLAAAFRGRTGRRNIPPGTG